MNNTSMNQGLVNPFGDGMQQVHFIVHSFMIIGTGTYQPLQLRPYTGNLTTQSLQMFMERTNNGVNVNAGTLAGMAGYLMAPSTAPTGQIAMPNGFNQERVRWFMVIQVVRPGNFQTLPVYQIIAGYSDTPEIDFNQGLVSPNLALRINSVTTVRQLATGDVVVDDTSHLIYQMPNFAAALGMAPRQDFTVPRMQTMMPEDVMSFIGSGSLGGTFGGDGIDGRGQNMMAPVIKSRRTNGLVTNYLDMSLNAYTNAVLAPDYHNADIFEMASYARSRVAENSVSADQFIMMMRTRTDYDARGFLTYNELCGLLPDADMKCQVFDNRFDPNAAAGVSGPVQFGTNHAGNFVDWANQMPETLFATRIIQTIPAIMSTLSLTYIQIIATNRTIDGSECKIDYYQPNSPIPALNLNPFLRRLTERLVVEVFRDLSLHNQIDYFVSIVVDVFGDTFVRVSLNGGHEIDYNMPSFSDALAIPVLATDQIPLMSLTHTVQQLTANIVPQQHQNHTLNHNQVMQAY